MTLFLPNYPHQSFPAMSSCSFRLIASSPTKIHQICKLGICSLGADFELFDVQDKICALTQTLFKLFGPSLPFQQVAGTAILFNAEIKFPIRTNRKVGQSNKCITRQDRGRLGKCQRNIWGMFLGCLWVSGVSMEACVSKFFMYLNLRTVIFSVMRRYRTNVSESVRE